jgi:hypothetical protein
VEAAAGEPVGARRKWRRRSVVMGRGGDARREEREEAGEAAAPKAMPL